MKETITVKGMTCQHCEKSVHDALTNVDGVESVDIHLDPGHVEIEFDELLVKLSQLEEVIENQGYDVEV